LKGLKLTYWRTYFKKKFQGKKQKNIIKHLVIKNILVDLLHEMHYKLGAYVVKYRKRCGPLNPLFTSPVTHIALRAGGKREGIQETIFSRFGNVM